jgi:hypothetical protein
MDAMTSSIGGGEVVISVFFYELPGGKHREIKNEELGIKKLKYNVELE